MSTIRSAKKVLYELKKNGYEAYIVGGAVRDHLLNLPINDVDITTNAKPHQVSKIFRTVPTGIKYGTVTVLYGSETFEVTTYRIDGEYIDQRHPENITYSDLVEDDVKRRDFTINGLLMDEKSEITDFVNGRVDLTNKLIKTIGNPKERFAEDALRMMRAFYFQSKLGFQIDKETREEIFNLRENLKSVSIERITNELIKTLQGEHVKKAIKSIITTKVHEVLPGLEKGFLYIENMEEIPFVDAFFTLSFALNKEIPKEWKFSNKHKNRYEIASMIVRDNIKIDNFALYTYGIDLCLLANKVNYMLNKTKNLKTKIEEDYKKLPIQSDLDLKLRPSEMIELAGKKAGAWVTNIQKEMVKEILTNKLKNEKDALEKYLLEHI
jgi:tRNA nucleotidyltransferase (CCA-adding enzyme)